MPRGGARPGAGRPPKVRDAFDGTAAIKFVQVLPHMTPPRPPAKVISIREAMGKLHAVPAATAATPAPPATGTPGPAFGAAAPPPAHPLFAEGWQKFFSKRGTTMYVAWAEEHIRRKKGKVDGVVDEDEVDMLALSLEQGLREQFPTWSPPWWIVACWCAGGIYWTLDKTGKPDVTRREPTPAADTEPAEPPSGLGTKPPPQPEQPAVDVPPGTTPKSWQSFATRLPPARKVGAPAAP